MTVMCQHSFINCNNPTSQAGDVDNEGYVCEGRGCIESFSIFPQLCCRSKSALKIKSVSFFNIVKKYMTTSRISKICDFAFPIHSKSIQWNAVEVHLNSWVLILIIRSNNRPRASSGSLTQYDHVACTKKTKTAVQNATLVARRCLCWWQGKTFVQFFTDSMQVDSRKRIIFFLLELLRSSVLMEYNPVWGPLSSTITVQL